MLRLIILLAASLLALPSAAQNTDLGVRAFSCKGGAPAFPGARGWGQCATGWRGGAIVKVTNTNDTGAGSLRECLELHFPRVCLFDIGGTIEVNEPLDIRLNTEGNGGNVYVAGQSAPEDSGGIQVTLAATNASASTLQIFSTSDVLVRHLRLRPGEGQVSTASVSGILCRNCQHTMLDHVSIQYATDQNLTVNADAFSFQATSRAAARYITIQDSILAFALHASNHPDTPHSKAGLLCQITGGDFTAGDRCGYMSMIGNYIAHNNDRNPELQSNGEPFEFVNNLIYNPTSDILELVESNGAGLINVISNAVFEGSNTVDAPAPRLIECTDNGAFEWDVYLFGNIDEDNRAASNAGGEADVIDPALPCNQVSTPVEALTGPIIRADDLASIILPTVGATAPARDALDTLVTGHCCPGNAGSRVDDPVEVTGAGLTGGFPTLAAGTAPVDTDGDGMPDAWEDAFGVGFSTFFDAWADRNSDGWSNLEEYLNFRAGDIPDPRP